MSESDAVILVADRDGQLVGYVFGQVEPPSLVSLTRSTGWIHDLYVSPDARGLGAGGKLLDQAIQAFQLIGPAGGIMLAVASQNAAAATLFQARGFRPTLQEMTLSPLPSC
jgi:ribosomal protein S18 acetylase RimI-like enzyme